jgi:hypothetical protein
MDIGRIESRGSLKHFLSGETHQFHDWAISTTLIESFVANASERSHDEKSKCATV